MTDKELLIKRLELINRQQAKIDDLTERLNATIAGQESLQKALAEETKKREVQAERLREEREQKYEQIDLICRLRNEIAEKDRKIDDLKVENQSLRTAANCYKIHYNEARTEAIREFSKAVIDGIDEGYILHSSDMVDFTQNYLNVKGVLKMAENLRYKSVIIRKPHVCFGCGRSFDPPARMTSAAYADGGTVDSYYLCETCTGIASEMGFDDEFGFGDLRDEALEREQNG